MGVVDTFGPVLLAFTRWHVKLLQNWGRFGKSWGPIFSNWHPLMYIDILLYYWHMSQNQKRNNTQWPVIAKFGLDFFFGFFGAFFWWLMKTSLESSPTSEVQCTLYCKNICSPELQKFKPSISILIWKVICQQRWNVPFNGKPRIL